MNETVVVGLGRCGQELHLAALWEMSASQRPDRILGVDPRPVAARADVEVFAGAAPAWRALVAPELSVWHVATPPATHVPVVEVALDLGVRRVIVEKPFAPDVGVARCLLKRATEMGARLVPVAVWPHSAVIAALRSAFTSDHRDGPVSWPAGTELTIEQSKPRQQRSAVDAGHVNALQVEVPHQILLAIHLAGPVSEVVTARVWDGEAGGIALHGLGGARLELAHASGVRTRIVSDLCAPDRVRRVEIRTPGRTVTAELPLSAASAGGTITVAGQAKRPIADRPLTSFLNHAYASFTGRSEEPLTPIEDHLHLLEVLDRVAECAGRPS